MSNENTMALAAGAHDHGTQQVNVGDQQVNIIPGADILSAKDLAAAAAEQGADPTLLGNGDLADGQGDTAPAGPRELTFGEALVGVNPVNDPDENQEAVHIKEVFAHAATVIHNSADKGEGPTNFKQVALDRIVEACAQCVKHLTNPN